MLEAADNNDGLETNLSQISAALERLNKEPSDREALASLARTVEGLGSEAAPTGTEIDQRMVALLIKASDLLAAAGQENHYVALALKLALTHAGGDAQKLRTVADHAAGLGETESATTAYEAVVSRQPTSIDAWLRLVVLLRRQQRFQESLGAVERAIASNPEEGRLHIEHARCLYWLGDDLRAADAAEAAASNSALTADDGAEAVWILQLAGNDGRALQLVDHYLRAYGDAACLLLARGDVRCDQADYEGAESDYALARQDPDYSEAADLAKTDLFRQTGRLAAAETVMRQWESSSTPDTVLERVRLAEARREPAKVLVEMLKPLVEVYPSNDEALSRLSNALRIERHFDECQELVSHAFSGRVAYAAAVQRGWLAYDKANYEQAEQEFRSVPKHSAHFNSAIYGLSVVLLARGEISQAADLVEESLERQEDTELLRQRAWIAFSAGRDREAAATLEALVAKNPYDVTSRGLYARILMAASRFREAQAVLDSADTRQDDPTLTIERGWLAYYTSRLGEAQALFHELLGDGTDPIDAICGLSAVLRAQGRPVAAARRLEQALQAHVHDPSLLRELGWVAFQQRHFDDAAARFGALVKWDQFNIVDRRWQAASLRMAKKYAKAQEVLATTPTTKVNDPELDLERGWVAFATGDYQAAASQFRKAGEHRARPDLYVPPLVEALLRMDLADDAEKAAGTAPMTSSIAAARADIQIHKGYPENAIKLLCEFGTELDEEGLTQLVTLLHGAERDDEARKVFDGWLAKRCYKGNDVLSASASIVGTRIELEGLKLGSGDNTLRCQVESVLEHYNGPDPIPAVVATAAISTIRKIDKRRAKEIADDSVANHPTEVDLLIEAAKTSFAAHNYKAALEELDCAINVEPRYDRAVQWRCRSLRRLGKWDDLTAYLDEQIRLLKDSARLQIELGSLRLAKGDYLGAYEAFSDASRLDRSSQQALFGQVSALRRLQRWTEASSVVATWQERWPHSSRQRLAAAMLALDREDFPRSENLFTAVGDLSGLLGQAAVLVQQRRRDEAGDKLNEAMKVDPDRPGPKVALATLLAQDDANAKECADQLCLAAMGRGAESEAAAFTCRAQIALSQGHLRAAESLLEEAKKRNPYGTHAAALASVLVGMFRIDEAVNTLNERLTENPRDSSARYQLFRAYNARGDTNAALTALRAAAALTTGPGADAVAVELAYELEEHGSSTEAEQQLRSRLEGRDATKDDQLRLGLAWILLSRGERARSPALLGEVINEVNKVLAKVDPPSATASPAQIKRDALKCRGTAYYKLAEHERNPADRIRLAALARSDQGNLERIGKRKAPRRSGWSFYMAFGLDTGLRIAALVAAFAFTIVLWTLHSSNQRVWTTAMVLSLTPLFVAVALLAALLPQLKSLKLAGLEAQTRDKPDVPLPTSPSVALPQVTEFAAAAHENFLDTIDVSDLVGSSSTRRRTGLEMSVPPRRPNARQANTSRRARWIKPS
jgi:tetratricopeptide (TPR) repeat protein